MKRVNLRLICRTDRLSVVGGTLSSSYQAFGVKLLNRSIQTYWKDEHCSEVNYEFLSSLSNEQWYQFFCTVFSAENNTIEEDGRVITHNGSPILNDTEVFAYLFIFIAE